MKAKHALMIAALAMVVSPLLGCETTPVQQGAMEGSLLGAGLGAIIGNQSHSRGGEGALIGAGAGALAGALLGDQVQKNRETRPAYSSPQPQPQVQAPPPPQPAPSSTVVESGHYETRLVRTPSGETYEERVWVPDRP